MKIGIITFHWGTNYGAVLQTYALQTYLLKMGHDVWIINYRPKKFKKTLWNSIFNPRFYLIKDRIKVLIKEEKLEKFRRKHLNETKLYESSKDLSDNPPLFDVYITGSDQVWNPFFTTMGEGKPTSTYFLDFGPKTVQRIAYAVSFGCNVYPKRAEAIAKKYINNFNAISVRENTGINIMSELGFENAIKLPDPTLLLRPEDYNFGKQDFSINEDRVVVYILRNETKNTRNIISNLKKEHKINTIDDSMNPDSIESWLNKIRSSSIVITNSFHGMIFSLLFHVPFVITLSKENSSSMNDRFYSLLSLLDLESRIIYEDKVELVKELIKEEIEWSKIDFIIDKLKYDTSCFFENVL